MLVHGHGPVFELLFITWPQESKGERVRTFFALDVLGAVRVAPHFLQMLAFTMQAGVNYPLSKVSMIHPAI